MRRSWMWRALTIGIAILGIGRVLPGSGLAYDFPGWSRGAAAFEEAFSGAQSGDSPVLLYFHTDWCGWCKKLEADYFENADMVSFLEATPRAEVNPETSEEDKALGIKYGVKGYPTFLVLVPSKGTQAVKLHPFTQDGQLEVQEFVDQINAAAEKIKSGEKAPAPSQPAPAPRKIGQAQDQEVATVLTKDMVGKSQRVVGKVDSVEQYGNGIWAEVRGTSGTCWVLLDPKKVTQMEQTSNIYLEDGSTMEATGTVAKDKTSGELMVDVKTSTQVKWSERRPLQGETEAMAMNPLQVADLEDTAKDAWVSVDGKIESLNRQFEPDGMWIEFGSGEATAGVWIGSTVWKRLDTPELTVGDTIRVIGMLLESEDPLVGEFSLCTPSHLLLVQ